MAAKNQLVAQGILNRLVAAVQWTDFPELNVTAPFLGREGIRLALEGNSTTYLPTMTGAVVSQEPYMMINMTINLLKTQALAEAYKTQMELDSLLGDGQVFPDVPVGSGGLALYQLVNCSISDIPAQDYSGSSAMYPVTIRGYYNINQAFWNQ